jgi:phage FluMu protein Com
MKSHFNLYGAKITSSVQIDDLPTLEEEKRCCCGQLLARRTPTGIEIKCKRCKRMSLIQWENGVPVEMLHAP